MMFRDTSEFREIDERIKIQCRRSDGIDKYLCEIQHRLNRIEEQVFDVPQPAEPKMEGLNIGEAIEWLKKGWHVTRKCWRNENIYLHLYQSLLVGRGDEIRVKTIRGIDCVWSPNHDELLATDWRVITAGAINVSTSF